jgi:prepilin-type N-terminal cleavage/methylation domain-containing protein
METRLKYKDKQGFTLIETIVGMLIFLIASLAIVPVFFSYKAATIRNDGKVGAIAISQQIMDSLRQMDVRDIPSTGTNVPNLPNGDLISDLNFKGKRYAATITYCENASYCESTATASSRHLNVKVYNYGTTSQPPVFQLETVYTRLQ